MNYETRAKGRETTTQSTLHNGSPGDTPSQVVGRDFAHIEGRPEIDDFGRRANSSRLLGSSVGGAQDGRVRWEGEAGGRKRMHIS